MRGLENGPTRPGGTTAGPCWAVFQKYSLQSIGRLSRYMRSKVAPRPSGGLALRTYFGLPVQPVGDAGEHDAKANHAEQGDEQQIVRVEI